MEMTCTIELIDAKTGKVARQERGAVKLAKLSQIQVSEQPCVKCGDTLKWYSTEAKLPSGEKVIFESPKEKPCRKCGTINSREVK